MKKLSKRDYKKITKFYKSKKHTRKNALKTISRKFCSCVEKVKTKKKGEAIGICTKSVINRKGFKRGKFSCKRKPSIQLYKGGKRRKKTRKKKGGMTLEEELLLKKEFEDRTEVSEKDRKETNLKKHGGRRTSKKKTRNKRGGESKYEIGAKWKPRYEHPNRKTTLEILPWNKEDVISTFRLTEEQREEIGEEDIEALVEGFRTSHDGWLLLGVQQIDTGTDQIVQSHKTLQTKGDLLLRGKYIGSVEHGGGKRRKKTRKRRRK